MTALRFLTFLALPPLVLAGCGGSTTSGSAGGSQSGGSGSGTGGVGTAGSGGVTGTGGVACCTAAAVCDAGDKEISSADQCPLDGECYSHSICCSTVYCVRATVNCFALPACDPGDTQQIGPCPSPYSCYSRSACGVTVMCVDTVQDAGVCNPDTEYNRNYVDTDPQQCQDISFGCVAYSRYFINDCGCGCEQDPTCPESVDCTPGQGTMDPLCSADSTRCPYTIRYGAG